MNQVKVGNFTIGGDSPLTLLAGPCVLESLERSLLIGRTVKEICGRLGINYVETRNDQINAVTLDQVKAAAKRILDAGEPTIVTVGPKAS